jgi:PAS domain S-box-containing protein
MRPGARLDEHFGLLRPEGSLTHDWIRQHLDSFFLLRHRGSDLSLRGSFMALPGDGGLLFLGSPWFTDATEVAAHGLNFDDFALHDPVLDLLQVFQANKVALADARRLADKLSRQRQELRDANARLSEKEAQARTLALIAARTDNGVVLTDAEGRVVWINEGFTRLTGYRLAELEGRTPGSVLQGAGTDPDTVRRIGESLRRGDGFAEEILNYHKDGRPYWIAVEVQPIRDDAGRIVNFMAIESDVTERRASRQRLALQYEISSVLAEAGEPAAVVNRILAIVCQELGWRLGQSWQADGERLRIGESWHGGAAGGEEFAQASRAIDFAMGEGFPGLTWVGGEPQWVRDVTREPRFLRGRAAAAAGLRSAIWFPILKRGEAWAVLEFFSDRLEEPDESLLRTFAAVGEQIGQFLARREAEEALREGEERFRAAFEDAHAGIAIGSTDAVFNRVNRTLCEMLGYSEAELLGRSSLEFTHPDDIAATQAAAARMKSGETDRIEIEKRFVRKDGRAIWVVVRGRRHRGVAGESDLLISHFLDITERKAAEQRALAEAVLVEQARQRELETGRQIQRALLIGERVAGLRGVDIAAYAEPSEVIDGDFSAFTGYRPDCFELLVGDVMGKGVPAALVGAGVRMAYNQVVTELVATALERDELPVPAAIVNALHAKLTPRLVALDTFVTLALYRFDLAKRRVTYVNAGHTPALLLDRAGSVAEVLGENLPLGVAEGERYQESSLAFSPGDRLTVYSDGLTEARSPGGELFGEERLRDFLSQLREGDIPAAACLEALRKQVRDFVGSARRSDDQTAVMVAFVEADGEAVEDTEILELPWNAAGFEPLRHRVGAAAAGLGPDAASRLVLGAFEVATNVVRHVPEPFPGATLTCAIRREPDRVVVELWHVGEPFDPGPAPSPDDTGLREGGFGLYIIEMSVSEVSRSQPAPNICRTRLVQLAEAG